MSQEKGDNPPQISHKEARSIASLENQRKILAEITQLYNEKSTLLQQIRDLPLEQQDPLKKKVKIIDDKIVALRIQSQSTLSKTENI